MLVAILLIRFRETILSEMIIDGKFLMIISNCFLSSILIVRSHRLEFSILDLRKYFIQIVHTRSVIVQSASSDLLASGGLGDE